MANAMNLILLFESDFIDKERTMVRLTGRRKEHALSVCKAVPGDTLRVGLLNGKTGSGKVETVSGKSMDMMVTLNAAPPQPLPLTLILALPRPKALKRCIEAITAMGVKKNIHHPELQGGKKLLGKPGPVPGCAARAHAVRP